MAKRINFNLFKKKIIINMSNKSFYSFIAFGVIGLFVAGFFIVNALTPGIAPNPGHLITQVAPPAGCGSGQVLGWSGSSWGLCCFAC